MSTATRWISLLLIPLLALVFMQPQAASAQTNTFSATKTFSNSFPCVTLNGTNTPFPSTTPLPGQTVAATPGQCVEVTVTIGNPATNTTNLTNATINDTLPATLIGQGGTGNCILVPAYGTAAAGNASCTVAPGSFTFSTSSGAITPGQTLSVTFVTQIAANACAGGNAIPNTATLSNVGGTTGAFTGNTGAGTGATAGALALNCAPAAPTGTFTLAKALTSCDTGAPLTTAVPGQCVLVQIAVRNSATSTAPITGVSLTDNLPATLIGQPGTCSAGTADCTVTANSFTLNTAANIAPGGAGFVRFQAQVSPAAVPGTPISNTVTGTVTPASFTQVNAGLATSSLTVAGTPVQVPVPNPYPYPYPVTSSFLLCGTVTQLVTVGTIVTSMTIGGVVVPIATAGATYTITPGVTFAVNVPVCVRVAFVAAVANVVQVVPYATGFPVICGVYTAGTTPGYMYVNGVPVAYTAGMTFPQAGYQACFLINNGYCYAYLSTVPTSIKTLQHHRHINRHGLPRPE